VPIDDQVAVFRSAERRPIPAVHSPVQIPCPKRFHRRSSKAGNRLRRGEPRGRSIESIDRGEGEEPRLARCSPGAAPAERLAYIIEFQRIVEREAGRPAGVGLDQFRLNLGDVFPSCTSLVKRLVVMSVCSLNRRSSGLPQADGLSQVLRCPTRGLKRRERRIRRRVEQPRFRQRSELLSSWRRMFSGSPGYPVYCNG
jgi:hypothetical protein